MNEISYSEYQKKRKEADSLLAQVKELYADRGFTTDRQMVLKAKMEGIITGDEWATIQLYCFR